MKIIFVDVDGVLNEKASFARDDYDENPTDPALVARLNRIVRETGAKIVVSSAWRIYENHVETLRRGGVEGDIIGATPSSSDTHYPHGRRAGEILTWLETASVTPTHIVALDDDSDVLELGDVFVRTNLHTGLTEADVERAIAVLNTMPWADRYATAVQAVQAARSR